MHLKGRGGIKGSVRCIQNHINQFPFVARFNVNSYYNSINHKILLGILKKLNVEYKVLNVITDYIQLPDKKQKGKKFCRKN